MGIYALILLIMEMECHLQRLSVFYVEMPIKIMKKDNINSRLLHYFGNEYALVIESENKPSMGMKVTIKVPLVQE